MRSEIAQQKCNSYLKQDTLGEISQVQTSTGLSCNVTHHNLPAGCFKIQLLKTTKLNKFLSAIPQVFLQDVFPVAIFSKLLYLGNSSLQYSTEVQFL